MRMYIGLVLGLLGRALRSRNDLLMENLVLRQQLAVYARRQTKPQLHNEDRIFWSVVARRWRPWRVHLQLVQPDTVIRWHRTAWRRYWFRQGSDTDSAASVTISPTEGVPRELSALQLVQHRRSAAPYVRRLPDLRVSRLPSDVQ